MTDITSHPAAFPTAYTQLGTSISAPQVDTVECKTQLGNNGSKAQVDKVDGIISGGAVTVLNVPYVSNLWLALEIIHNGKGYNIVDPENFLKGGSGHE